MRPFLVFIFLFFVMSAAMYGQHVANQTSRYIPTANVGFLEYLPAKYNSTVKKYPLLIFLHGAGEKGNGSTDLPKVALHGPPMYIRDGHNMTFNINGIQQTFIVISPQLPSSYSGWHDTITEAVLNHAIANYRVDMNRIYITGMSMGGNGTWRYAYSSQNSNNKFAAIAPVAGWGFPGSGCVIANRKIPVWAFHGALDDVVTLDRGQSIVDAVNNCTKPVANPKALFTVYPDGGHDIWDRAYNPGHDFQNPNVYEWLLSYKKGVSTIPNTAPVVNAGTDKTYELSSDTLILSGTATDSDGSVTSQVWSKISGGAATMSDSNTLNLKLSNIEPGTYVFRLTAKDNKGAQGFDEVTVYIYDDFNTILEAEEAEIFGVYRRSFNAGYTGTGYADFTNLSNDYIEWSVNTNSAGLYNIAFRYAHNSPARILEVKLNNVVINNLSFPGTSSWTNWSLVNISADMIKGNNKVRLTAIGASGPNVDNIQVTVAGSSARLSKKMRSDNANGVITYPSPASDFLYVDSNQEVKISILNLYGAAIQTQYSSINGGQMDVSHLPEGLYVLLIQSATENSTQKLIIKR